MDRYDAKKILAGPPGVVRVSKGSVVCARPAARGESFSACLLEDGSMVRLKGSMIAGVGARRYFEQAGFSIPDGPHPEADRLAELCLDMDSGKTLERAMEARVKALSESAGEVEIVPFDPALPSWRGVVERGMRTMIADLRGGMLMHGVGVSGGPSGHTETVSLAEAWVLPPGGRAPRVSEHGGSLERALFVLANSGLAVIPAEGMVADPEDERAPRGRLDLILPGGDTLSLCVSAMDEARCSVLRRGRTVGSSEVPVDPDDFASTCRAVVSSILLAGGPVQERAAVRR